MHGAATKLKGGLSDANAKIEALQDAAAISSGGKDATAAKLAEVSEELASLKQQHEVNQMALKEQLEASTSDLAASQATLTELQGSHAALETEAEGLKSKLEAAQAASAAAQEALSLAKQEFDKFGVESSRKLRDAVKEAHESEAATVAFHRDTAKRLEEEVQTAIAAKEQAEGRVEVFLKQTEAAKAMAVGLRKELVVAKEEHGRREAAQRTEAAAAHALELQALRDQLEGYARELQQLQKQQKQQQQEKYKEALQNEQREEPQDKSTLKEKSQEDGAIEPTSSSNAPSPTIAHEDTPLPAEKEGEGDVESNDGVPTDSEEALALAVAAALGTDAPWSDNDDASSKAGIASDEKIKALEAAEATAAAAEARAVAAESELSAAKSVVGALKRELANSRALVDAAEARANNTNGGEQNPNSSLTGDENFAAASMAATASAANLPPKSSPKNGYSSKNRTVASNASVTGNSSADAQRALSFAALVHSAEKLEADALAENLKGQLAQTTRALEATWRKATAAERDSEEQKTKLEQVRRVQLHNIEVQPFFFISFNHFLDECMESAKKLSYLRLISFCVVFVVFLVGCASLYRAS